MATEKKGTKPGIIWILRTTWPLLWVALLLSNTPIAQRNELRKEPIVFNGHPSKGKGDACNPPQKNALLKSQTVQSGNGLVQIGIAQCVIQKIALKRAGRQIDALCQHTMKVGLEISVVASGR